MRSPTKRRAQCVGGGPRGGHTGTGRWGLGWGEIGIQCHSPPPASQIGAWRASVSPRQMGHRWSESENNNKSKSFRVSPLRRRLWGQIVPSWSHIASVPQPKSHGDATYAQDDSASVLGLCVHDRAVSLHVAWKSTISYISWSLKAITAPAWLCPAQVLLIMQLPVRWLLTSNRRLRIDDRPMIAGRALIGGSQL